METERSIPIIESVPDVSQQRIFLYDGVCGVCNKFVNFVTDRDPQGRIKFTALEGKQGKRLQKNYDLERLQNSTSVFLHQGVAYTKSFGIIKCLATLGGLWYLMLLFLIVPACIRDPFYDCFSKMRFAAGDWMGWKESTCRLYSPTQKALHFLPDE